MIKQSSILLELYTVTESDVARVLAAHSSNLPILPIYEKYFLSNTKNMNRVIEVTSDYYEEDIGTMHVVFIKEVEAILVENGIVNYLVDSGVENRPIELDRVKTKSASLIAQEYFEHIKGVNEEKDYDYFKNWLKINYKDNVSITNEIWNVFVDLSRYNLLKIVNDYLEFSKHDTKNRFYTNFKNWMFDNYKQFSNELLTLWSLLRDEIRRS